MGKKSSKGSPKSAKSGKEEATANKSAGKRSAMRYIASALAVVLAVGGGIVLKKIYAGKPSAPGLEGAKSESRAAAPYKRRELRPTMSPSAFSGVIASTYQIAREIPEVLDQIYCYCKCKENFGHLSLLTCYLDRHAST